MRAKHPKTSNPRGSDGLTDNEREFVKYKIKHPDWDNTRCAIAAGFAKSDARNQASRLMRRGVVRLALAAKTPDPKTGKIPKITREWLQEQMQKLYLDPRTPINERTKLLDKLGGTVQGFYVPVGIRHEGRMTLEGLLGEVLPTSAPQEDGEQEVKH